MHLLLFEGPTHLLSQFIKKLPDGAVVEVAGILRQYLAREDSHLTGGSRLHLQNWKYCEPDFLGNR